jgi:hypothetical protein
MWWEVAKWTLVAVGGGLLFRFRGGLIPVGSTTLARAIWAIGMAAGAAALLLNWKLLAIAPCFFAGVLMGWGSYTDLGRMTKTDNETLRPVVTWLDSLIDDKRDDFSYDCIGLVVRGFILTAPVGAYLQFSGDKQGWMYCFAGVLMACSYIIGWAVPSRIKGFQQGTEVGEVVFGAALATTLYAVLVL